jgi:hypothetical protein
MVSSRNNHRNGHVLVGNHQTQIESDNDAAINKCECFILLQSSDLFIYILFKTCLLAVSLRCLFSFFFSHIHEGGITLKDKV